MKVEIAFEFDTEHSEALSNEFNKNVSEIFAQAKDSLYSHMDYGDLSGKYEYDLSDLDKKKVGKVIVLTKL